MEIRQDCIEILNSKRIVCEENKRRITFINFSNFDVSKIRVDGCQIIDGIKCDFLIKFNSNERFIELKGSDVNHAIKQLMTTIKILGNCTCVNRISYIISSRCPISAADIQVYRLKFRKNYNSRLIVKNNNFEEKI